MGLALQKRRSAIASLLVLACALGLRAKDLAVDFDARAYFESAYLSSVGTLAYTEPVAEQYGVLTARLRDYGRIRFDAWLCSALNGQRDDVHRRAFYICEDTLMYGYDLEVSKGSTLSTIGGVLWDFLGGYKEKQDFPIFWYANQAFRNPYLTPYWNFLGRMDGKARARVRFGVERPFELPKSIAITPFVEGVWGDANRFEANYGARPDNDWFLGGVMMLSTFGITATWHYTEHFYFWGRYRQYILVDSQARDLVSSKNTPTAETAYPIFGLGVGCHF